MIKNKIHKCWRLGAGILLLNIAIFTVGCSSKSVDSKETTTNSETTVAQTTVPETTTVNYKKLINFKAEHPFYIKVNKKENFAIVYGIDKKGKYSVPYKAFVCSTGREDDFTPNGTFTVSEKYRWRLMVDNTYAQYAVRIQGQIMLHSVPYTSPESDALEYWEYNKLGNVASLGCVRFQVADIKWIYDNCPEGTKVKIYSKANEKSVLPLPETNPIHVPHGTRQILTKITHGTPIQKLLRRNVKRRKKKQKQQLLTATQTAKKKQLAEKQSVVKQQQNQAIQTTKTQTTKQQQRKTQNQRQLKKLRKKKTQQRKTIQKKQTRKILQKRRLKNKLRRKQKK